MFRLRHLRMLLVAASAAGIVTSALAAGTATTKIQDRLTADTTLMPSVSGLSLDQGTAAAARGNKADRETFATARLHDEQAIRETIRTITVETRIGANTSVLTRVPVGGVAAR